MDSLESLDFSSFVIFSMTLGPSSSAFISFLSYHWLFNVATSFVNGPLHNIYTDPAKQCTNVTVEEVEYGDWECKTAVWEDMANPSNEAKICVVKHLKCWDGRYADCALICVDNSTHFGWYYQVKIGIHPFLDFN